jgi:hypothetical protein
MFDMLSPRPAQPPAELATGGFGGREDPRISSIAAAPSVSRQR